MKKIPQDLDDKLLDYLDGKLTSSERQSFETLLHHDAGLQTRLDEFRAVNTLMRQIKPEQPSINFTGRVMGGLDASPVRSNSLRGRILLIFGVLLTTGIAAALISMGTFDNATSHVDLNVMKIPKQYINTPLPSFSIDGKLLVNCIIFLNLAIVFVVLDRLILKPYFQRRIHASH